MFALRKNVIRIVLLLAAVIGAVIGSPRQVRAADSFVDVVPEKALAWGVVNHMDAASEKVQNLAKLVQMPVPNMLDSIKKESGMEKGVDDKGAFGFFVVPGKTEKDTVTAGFIAVTDEKEFLANFKSVKTTDKISEVTIKRTLPNGQEMPEAIPGGGERRVVGFVHGYAVFAPKEDRAAVEAAVAAKKSIAGEMAGYEKWLEENDASVVGTAAGIKYAAQQVHEEMKKPSSTATTSELLQITESFQKYFGKAMDAAPSELSLAAAGIRCDKQSAIRVIGRARLIQGGEISKAVAKMPPVDENLLSGVSGGPFVFAMAGVGIPGVMDSYMALQGDLLKALKAFGGMPDDQLVKQSIEAARQIRSMSFVMKLGKRSEPLYSNIFATMKVDNAEKVLDLQEKFAEAVNNAAKTSKQGMYSADVTKRLQVAGKPAIEQELTFNLTNMPSGAPGTPGAAAGPMLDQMLGPGGKMVLYYVAADEHTIVMGMGVPQERMTNALEVLKQPKKSLAEDADVAVTAAMLPEKSQWTAYVSFRGYSQMTIRLMAAALKSTPGGENFTMPAFPKCPPLGFGVKATPDELHAEIVVPPALTQATGDYVKEAQAAMMQRMMEQNHPPAP